MHIKYKNKSHNFFFVLQNNSLIPSFFDGFHPFYEYIIKIFLFKISLFTKL